MSDLTWVDQTMVIDAIDPARKALDENPGWRLLHVGMGSGGQTTLTYGWPWPGNAAVDLMSGRSTVDPA